RGGILVQFLQLNGKGTDGLHHQGSEQTGAVGPLQVVESAADAVIVEQRQLVGTQVEVFGNPACDPGGQGVQRLACQQQVGEQDGEGDRGGQSGRPARQRRQVALEQLGQLQAVQEVADQRGGADFEGLQRGLLPTGGHESLRGKRRAWRLLWEQQRKRQWRKDLQKNPGAAGWRPGPAAPGFFCMGQECGRPTPGGVDWQRCGEDLGLVQSGGQWLRPGCRVNGWKMPELVSRNVGSL